jgi:hypothetical protein
MRTWKGWLFAMAALALAVTALPTRADEANKLTILSFSAPVDLPGVVLPAGKYRFEIADPVESRKVIRVSSEDGSKQIAMLLTIPNQMLQPANDPVVMFTETAAGAPHAIKAWFYPGESIGYEFVYPHDQALRIARSNHAEVLASDKDNKVGRVNENDQFNAVGDQKSASSTSSAAGKSASNESSRPTFANSGAITTVDSSKRPAANPQASTSTTTSSSRAAQADTSAARADAAASQSAANTAANTGVDRAQSSRARSSQAVGTSGQSGTANRRELPRTASPLPWIALLSGLSLAGAFGVRRLRQAL